MISHIKTIITYRDAKSAAIKQATMHGRKSPEDVAAFLSDRGIPSASASVYGIEKARSVTMDNFDVATGV